MDSQKIISSSRPILAGIVISNIFGLVMFSITRIVNSYDEQAGGTLIFADFVIVPVVIGIVSMYFWIRIPAKTIYQLIPWGILNAVVAILIGAVFMGEGAICVLIVSPLIIAFVIIGMIIGRSIFKDKGNTIKASTAIVILGLFIWDNLTTHNYTNVVVDEIIVNAPASEVWKYVAEHPVNTSKPDYWLFQIGMPDPIQSTVSAHSVGANRKCIFKNNAVFDEVIVDYKKDSLFTFDILTQPNDPEIIGHIEIQRGQFVLKQNPDGSTLLTGTSWYKLNVYPAWYYDLWAEDITREVHIRVMKHIKALAEKKG
jgi:hypothetical protein